MTPRGGPTLDFSLFGRYFLDLAVFYPDIPLPRAPVGACRRPPGAPLCWQPLSSRSSALQRGPLRHLRAGQQPPASAHPAGGVLAAALAVGPEVSVSQTAFLFAVSGVMMAVCSLLSVVLNARAEVGNDAPACLVSTSLLKLGLSAVLCIIFWFTAVQWSRWLLRGVPGAKPSGSRRGRCPPSTRLSSSSACRWTRPSCSSTV